MKRPFTETLRDIRFGELSEELSSTIYFNKNRCSVTAIFNDDGVDEAGWIYFNKRIHLMKFNR